MIHRSALRAPTPRRSWLPTLATLLLLAGALPGPARAQGPPPKLIPAPAWELKDLDGKTVRLADFKGKVVILDFWATWCPPCRKEIPGFVELQKKYANRGLTVVGISLDEEGPAVVKPFLAKEKMNYPVVLGDPQTVSAYGDIQSIPTTFVIDRQGRIVSAHVGYAEVSVFEKEVQPLL